MARPRRESAARGEKPHRGQHERPPRDRPSRERKEPRTSISPQKRQSAASSSQSSSQVLSVDSLAKLDAQNANGVYSEKVTPRHKGKVATGRVVKDRRHVRRKRRVVSGAVMEEGAVGKGRARKHESKRRYGPLFWIAIGVVILLLVILIPVGVLVVGKRSNSNSGSSSSGSKGSGSKGGPAPSNGNLAGISRSDIPAAAKGTILDPFVWYDTTDFNVTYTDVKVGGLPIMGLNTSFDDTKRANENTPPLNEPWQYGTMPIRGMNVGGWLNLEPFITPSLFESYDSKLGIVDEYTLCQHLGPSGAAQALEKHYATFVTEQTMADIQAAGLDHVRIPFAYWAVVTYPGDPYVPQISWRYLLRGIEWARKHGLRVKLDLHGVPGSQNGWNHSGRQGAVGWLNGTDGPLNGQRSLDIHDQLSKFFAQPRYKNIVAIYGLVNEPKMTKLPVADVITWTTSAAEIVRKNGITAQIAFGDGFLGLPNWKGKLQGIQGLVLDVHQYVIFNTDQIAFTHKNKIDFTCGGWAAQMTQSSNPTTGFGPTICGEWSQADTDCAQYLNNVNVGSRWTGTMNTDDPTTAILTPSCPPNSGTCQCTDANADPSRYSADYKKWLKMFAEAQMLTFEKGYGWFYWTWETERSVQWSWKLGLKAGILPDKAYAPSFNCSVMAPALAGLPENY